MKSPFELRQLDNRWHVVEVDESGRVCRSYGSHETERQAQNRRDAMAWGWHVCERHERAKHGTMRWAIPETPKVNRRQRSFATSGSYEWQQDPDDDPLNFNSNLTDPVEWDVNPHGSSHLPEDMLERLSIESPPPSDWFDEDEEQPF